ncbi:MAG: hypothetical protein MJZ75_04245 [Paludibacteraceae bacterium]|nr:hypothetical protein [Paludibacteraceae bacterium]
MKKNLFLVLFAFLFAGIATVQGTVYNITARDDRSAEDYSYASIELALVDYNFYSGDSLLVDSDEDIYFDFTINKVARINFDGHQCAGAIELAAEKSYDYPLALYNLKMLYAGITTTSDMTASLILNNVETDYDVTLNNMGDSCVIVGGEYTTINSSIDNLILSGSLNIGTLQYSKPFTMRNVEVEQDEIKLKPDFSTGDTVQVTKEGGAEWYDLWRVKGTNMLIVYDDGSNLYKTTGPDPDRDYEEAGPSLGKPYTLFAIAQYDAINETTGKKYMDVQEAINDANEGETVKMLADYNSHLSIGKPMTLDMNTYSLSNYQDNTLLFPSFDGSVYVKNGIVGNIDGAQGDQNFSGTIYLDNMKVTNDTYTDGHTLYISGGKFSKLRQTGATSAAKGHIYLSGTVEMATTFSYGIYLYDYADLGCALTMNVPSALLPAERKYYFNQTADKPTDSKDIIAAHNGTFAELTYMSFSQSEDKTNFVFVYDDGSVLKDKDGNTYYPSANNTREPKAIWAVKKTHIANVYNVNKNAYYSTWTDAYTAASDNDTLRLLNALTSATTIDKAITVDLNGLTNAITFTINCASACEVGFKNGTANSIVADNANQATVRLEGAIVTNLATNNQFFAVHDLKDGANVTLTGSFDNLQQLTTATALISDLKYISVDGYMVAWANGTGLLVDVDSDPIVEGDEYTANTLWTLTDFVAYNIEQKKTYGTFAEAVDDVAAGQTVRLKKNITGEQAVNTDAFILDLNNKSMDNLNATNVTIKNGTVGTLAANDGVTLSGKLTVNALTVNNPVAINALAEGSAITLADINGDKQITTATANEADLQYFFSGASYAVVYDNGTDCVDKDGNSYGRLEHDPVAHTIWATSRRVALNVTTNTSYATLADAIADATANDEIRLIYDVEETAALDKVLTLDLAGNTLNAATVSADGVTLTNGTVSAVTAANAVALSGAFVCPAFTTSVPVDLTDHLSEGAAVNMILTGSGDLKLAANANADDVQYVTFNGPLYTVVYDNGTALMDKDGKFHAGNHTYEASTLWAVRDDATYKAMNVTTGVKYTDLQAAITAAHAKDEIALLVDIANGTATIDKPLTFNMNGHSITGKGVTSNGVLYVQNMEDTVIVKNGTIPTIDGTDADPKAYTGYLITENMNVTDGIWVDGHHLTMNGTYYEQIHNHRCGNGSENPYLYGDVYVKGYETYVKNGVATDGSWTYGGGFIRLQGGFFGVDPTDQNIVPVYVDKGYRKESLVPVVIRDGKTYKYIVRPLLAFDAQNGTTPDSVSIKNPYDAIGTMGIELPVPENGANQFLGWFTAPEGGEQVTAETVLEYEPQTIYAQWTDKYVVADTTLAERMIPLFESLYGKTVKLQMIRTLAANSYNTFCAPFAMTATEIANSPLAGAQLYEFAGANVTEKGTTRQLVISIRSINEFEAGQPMLIVPSAEISDPVFENVKIQWKEAWGQTVVGDNVDYAAVMAPRDIAEEFSSSPDYLGLLANGRLGWADATKSTGLMRGFRAIFHVKNVSGQAGAPTRGMAATLRMVSNTTTDNETIELPVNVQKIRHFDRIVIIKDGVRYDLLGHTIR